MPTGTLTTAWFNADNFLKEGSVVFDTNRLFVQLCISNLVPFALLLLANIANDIVKANCQDTAPVHAFQEFFVSLGGFRFIVELLISVYHNEAAFLPIIPQ